MVRRNAYYLVCTCPIMHNCSFLLLAAFIVVVVIFGGCTSPAPSSFGSPSPSPPVNQHAVSTVHSETFMIRAASLTPGSVLPDVYTCKGTSESPEVAWSGVPNSTKSLVLILDDPDAPNGRFTHWIVFNIPPDSHGLSRAQPNTKVLANGAQQGQNSDGSRSYYPPCPPIGTTHRYVFRLYAVDMDISQPTADRESIDWALTGHTIAATDFTTTFKR
jgi:Raf kinase inhibitor-like YbhB/YbcL family protein